MHAFRRKEPYRYTFPKSLNGFLQIDSINGVSVQSPPEKIFLIDISPNGMRIKCGLDLPIEGDRYCLEITFRLNDAHFSCKGVPVWKKQAGSGTFFYGIKGFNNEITKREITEQLKIYVRQNAKIKSIS